MKQLTNTYFKVMQMCGFVIASFGVLANATEALPKSFVVKVGTYNGAVAALAAVGDAKTLKLYTNTKGNLSVSFTISAQTLSSSLTLAASFKQNRSADTFMFKVLNSDGRFINIGSTTGLAGGYKSLSYAIPESAVINGFITVKMISSAGADDCEFDKLVISDQLTTPPPPPPTTTTPTTSAISVGTTWYWQLQGNLRTEISAKVFDIDLEDTTAAQIASLKASGHTVVCYFSAGSYEEWRADANSFLASSLGANLDGWPGERWLDVRAQNVKDVMVKRMDLAVSKGCQSLEPDNVDGYSNANGFGFTMQDQINYNSFLADQAHARGLTIGLKNSTDLVTKLVDKFDYAVVEECFKYNECSAYSPFIEKGKAVLNAEYSNYSSSICSQAQSLKFSTVFFNLDLDGRTFSPCSP